MKKLTLIITCILFSFTSLSARETFVTNDAQQPSYSWDLTDNTQKKVAVGMIAWGFLMATTTILLAVFVPNSTAPATTTTTP